MGAEVSQPMPFKPSIWRRMGNKTRGGRSLLRRHDAKVIARHELALTQQNDVTRTTMKTLDMEIQHYQKEGTLMQQRMLKAGRFTASLASASEKLAIQTLNGKLKRATTRLTELARTHTAVEGMLSTLDRMKSNQDTIGQFDTLARDMTMIMFSTSDVRDTAQQNFKAAQIGDQLRQVMQAQNGFDRSMATARAGMMTPLDAIIDDEEDEVRAAEEAAFSFDDLLLFKSSEDESAGRMLVSMNQMDDARATVAPPLYDNGLSYNPSMTRVPMITAQVSPPVSPHLG